MLSAQTAALWIVIALEAKEIAGLRFIPCHRIPSRSPHWFGRQFPLCYRCLSIVVGYAAVPVFLVMQFSGPLWLGIALNVPMVVDGWTQHRKWRSSNNALRVLTGLMSGIGQSVIVASSTLWLTNWLLKMF